MKIVGINLFSTVPATAPTAPPPGGTYNQVFEIDGVTTNATGISNATYFLGQTFLAPSSGNLGAFRMTMYRQTTGVTGNVSAYIYNCGASLPTTLLATSTNSIDVSTFGTTHPGASTFNAEWFFSAIPLVSGTRYWIGYGGAGVTFGGGANLLTSRAGGDLYASGAQALYTTSWTAHPSSWDLDVQIDYVS